MSLDSSCVRNKNGQFIGGAEASRRRAAAKLRRGTPILNPIQRERDSEFLSLSMNPSERFFTALFKSLPHKFLDSHHTAKGQNVVMEEICKRVRLPLPTPIGSAQDASEHLRRLAALVLEESRHAVAEALHQRWNRGRPPNNGLQLILSSRTTVTKHNHHVIFLRKSRPFTPRERFDIRNGTVFEIVPCAAEKPSLCVVVLGTVVSYAERRTRNGSIDFEADEISLSTTTAVKDDQDDRTIALMIYRDMELSEGASYRIYPLTSMVSQARQFEACTRTVSVAFLPALMGMKTAVHTKFHDHQVIEIDNDSGSNNDNDNSSSDSGALSDSDHSALDNNELGNDTKDEASLAIDEIFMQNPKSESDDSVVAKAKVEREHVATREEADIDDGGHKTDDPAQCEIPSDLEQAKRQFLIPPLNDTQQNACQAFLDSKPGSINLVQGPPGTGKSTLLTATICRYLLEDKVSGARRRLMVCGPTNKAVTVLASRYLKAAQGNPLFNAIMVGDKEKLLMEDLPGLRGIFAYTWRETMVEEWLEISRSLQTRDSDELLLRAKFLMTKLENQLPENSTYENLSVVTDDVTEGLLQLFSCGASKEKAMIPLIDTVRGSIARLTSKLRLMKEENIAQELLSTAHVIFCTLTSAGSSIMKRTDPVHDLIVDEAAAATEPELFIPFHLRPQRLMAVGDPKQLPATVMSRFAEKLGLNRSLHERLMFDCKRPYIMLDVQYRMKSAISAFPSASFYDRKIMNGHNVLSQSYGSTAALIMKGQPYTFVRVDGEEQRHASGSYHNQKEARKVVDLLGALQKEATSDKGTASDGWFAIDRIRVITFYQAQVDLIRNMLRRRGLSQVMVATVDSSQGCEADVVMISFVRCGKLAAEGADVKRTVGFLTDDRRLNVALTRAKYQLVCVGNVNGLENIRDADTIQALIKDAKARSTVSDFSLRYDGDKGRENGVHRNANNGKKGENRPRGKKRRKTDSKQFHRNKKPKGNNNES